MSEQNKPPSRSATAHLVEHDIRLTVIDDADGSSSVLATVLCARLQCTKTVEECGRCERFARIDVHEAGYLLLCRSGDDEPTNE